MTAKVIGRLDWDVKRDREGHRDYTLLWLLRTDSVEEGPTSVLNAPELPIVGSWWEYGEDVDFWAFCSPECTVRTVYSNEPGCWWTLENLFTTRPLKRCQDSTYEDPLSEPYRIDINFNPEKTEQYYDRNGKFIMNSAGEPFRGPEVEFDSSKPAVTIGMNLPDLPLTTIAQLMHCVNDSPLWGLSARCVKLSGCRARRLLYGTCSYYYSVDLDFDIDYNTFDRKLVDSGTIRIKDGGTVGNQEHVIKNRTSEGDMVRYFLDGTGHLLSNTANPVILTFQKYQTANLFLLGIPPSL
jgi:hypothetical protein